MTTLSTRIANATAPDRELDAEIAKAAGYTCQPDGYGIGNDWYDPSGKKMKDWGTPMGSRPPSYTSSVDAALTLVPGAMDVGMAWDWNERCAVVIVGPNALAGFPLADAKASHLNRDIALAQAIAAAAMKARGL